MIVLFDLLSANALNLFQSKQTCLVRGYLFTKQEHFGPLQIESICRQQIKGGQTNETCLIYRVENIAGKGEKAGYHHFLLFPQYVIKGLLPQGC